ncbi:UDP-N-acetylmuramoyl-L-alanyl-D-glutamate--2,6-diaminopimelate ligase [Catenovulum sediminis]|uniref:UDP-N-acetylmuramoyl-L-alanyl-D-glutamate--2,6-diaminopimelate ligase n=1 Tax=Catenovulum sediminis TaxID=1740262 RepID=A0ABV1RG21_9ALTE|nr:UDP-N-acetylmuramoyl-L-alanyl-D-glutamate--2,6-diaminopimelate ligase [Catenovulum sediminis]
MPDVMQNIEQNLNTDIARIVEVNLPAIPITAVQKDSRLIKENNCFLALVGHAQHGIKFAQLAIANGACIILQETQEKALHGHTESISDVPVVYVYDLKSFSGELAALTYGHASKALKVVGVTGTNGKTSLCDMICQLADNCHQQAAYIGTLGARWQDNAIATGLTTPDEFTLQNLLAEFVRDEVELAALEVSSHAMQQGRVSAVDFDLVAFTNLSHDHLDYHQSMQAYFNAKAELFIQNPKAIALINLDNQYGQKLYHLLQHTNPSQKLVTISQKSETSEPVSMKIESIAVHENGFTLECAFTPNFLGRKQSDSSVIFELPLIADFNITNSMMAVAALYALDYSLSSLQAAVQKLKAPAGRMEKFPISDSRCLVVDFAHTPEALEMALQACRRHCRGKLWVIFGCGGDRDQAKRRVMGQIAEKNADQIIITNDNPRSEEPQAIAQQIGQGINVDYQIELDRKQAIRLAVAQAQANDWILLAGKGHEKTQIFAEQTVEYDERAFVTQVAREAA